MANKKSKPGSNTIALNKKARHEYSLGDKFEAGLELQGWEVKSIRAGKVNISDTYIHLKNGEAFLLGSQIQPLNSASTHVICDPYRYRKLLLKKREIDRLVGSTERDGFTLVATAMYWKQCWVKLEFHLAKGKKLHDKREDGKEKDWAREKERTMKHSAR
ncbi:SsrA-binding protein SmpB [Pseudoalteromonas tunicata]|uniref:SsrA-binding protein n=1 Tax=Pseudoalteromonas tunicata D2 TaxID=87626 RepID=A4CD39_9GAMM|nr:SsrA-binding protein SmpB [Pseudoalteromonas tunicata]ATC93988.1 SsrA-binding protein [Pseudoalteromonas tunicata]AXT29774.1 SsrA-binding protein SmpB [Pseudoalteromonas tunicata]EAR27482.1 SsrA-binding protein [Pseudoalteromonas tunicata D2]MDP4982787.1 SsrA-binding protein SmpB [Pseudoalteromonas tunicata]MDP5213722.1 SsrA-binding protein SmpB [Pseudoalteromonas tunicata]